MKENSLFDTFGRLHNYLRISLTDKCNFRCTYCMPDEGMKFMPDDRLMKANEVVALAEIFKDLGVKKVRLTGGEPTLRKDLDEILQGLSSLDLDLSMTTNALLLDQLFGMLSSNGLKKLNISIDTLNPKKFKRISQRDVFHRVIRNIEEANERRFDLKINVVVIRNENDDEVLDMLRWSAGLGIPLRFIEYMPFFGNGWEYQKVFPKLEILERIKREFEVEQIISPYDSTSRNYLNKTLNASFGIIPTVSDSFCSGCSRIRLTADGKVKNCLFSNDENDLLQIYRSGQDVKSIIRKNILRKKSAAAGKINFTDEKARLEYAKNRSMVSIGG